MLEPRSTVEPSPMHATSAPDSRKLQLLGESWRGLAAKPQTAIERYAWRAPDAARTTPVGILRLTASTESLHGQGWALANRPGRSDVTTRASLHSSHPALRSVSF